MSGAPRRYFSGNTVAQAVMAAASHFGLAPERVAYRRVEKRHGFVKRARSVVIEVDPASPAREVDAAASPVAPAAARDPGHGGGGQSRRREGRHEAGHHRAEPDRAARPSGPPSDQVLAAAGEGITRLLALGGLALEATVRPAPDGVEVDLSGADTEVVLAADGEVLGALEALLPRLLRGGAGEVQPCRIDVGGRRASRAAQLQAEALAAAEQVRQSGAPVVFPPLAPAERRIIHLALAEQPGVRTESQGDDWRKRVTVLPSSPGGESR